MSRLYTSAPCNEYSTRAVRHLPRSKSLRTKASRSGALRSRGSVVVVVALSLIALLGLTGLVVDGGNMMATKRRAQNAADSAALAGAVALLKENSADSARNDALLYAQDNGFDHNQRDTTISVHSPPVSGPYSGNPKCVQVLVHKQLPSYFIRLLILRQPTVSAQAVATIEASAGAADGLICLNPNAENSLLTDSSAHLEVVGGGIMVNSNHSTALLADSSSRIKASRVRVTGGAEQRGDSSSVQPGPITGVPPVADPLAALPVPDPDRLGLSRHAGIGSPQDPVDVGLRVLEPGIYQGGIHLKGGIVTLLPGMYIMDGGGFQVDGSATVNGQAVTIYNTSYSNPPAFGPIRANSSGVLNISAPLTGPYKDILFFQDRNNAEPAEVLSSAKLVVLNGSFYFPKASFTMDGSGVTLDLLATQFIVDSIRLKSSANLRVNFANLSGSGTAQVSLVD